MPPFDLVIFDNDGVLVDSEPIANRHLAELLGEYGLAVGWHDCVERYLGSTLGRVRDLVEAELGGPIPADFEERYRATVYPPWPTRSRRCPGSPPCSTTRSGRRRHLRGLERAPPAHPRRPSPRSGLIDRFGDRLFSAEDVGVGKPAPDLFLHAAPRSVSSPSAAPSWRTHRRASRPRPRPAWCRSATPR